MLCTQKKSHFTASNIGLLDCHWFMFTGQNNGSVITGECSTVVFAIFERDISKMACYQKKPPKNKMKVKANHFNLFSLVLCNRFKGNSNNSSHHQLICIVYFLTNCLNLPKICLFCSKQPPTGRTCSQGRLCTPFSALIG